MKKRLLSLVLALLCVPAFAQFSPGQVLTASALNAQFALYLPLTGGTLTGPLTVPSITISSGITLSNLSPQAANTVVANFTGSSAAPVAFSMPSCSTTTSALQYTSGTGITCYIGAAPLASPAFTGTPTITNSAASGITLTIAATSNSSGAAIELSGNGASTPNKFIRVSSGLMQVVNSANSSVIAQLDDSGNLSQLLNINASGSLTLSQTLGIIGTTTNNNASTGSVGEFPSNSASGVSLTNATAANVTSTSLTAGDWDVQCGVQFIPAGGTTFTQGIVSVSTTSATQASLVSGGGQSIWSGSVVGQQEAVQSGIARLSLASSGTAYCVGTAGFSASTLTANGYIRARRVR